MEKIKMVIYNIGYGVCMTYVGLRRLIGHKHMFYGDECLFCDRTLKTHSKIKAVISIFNYIGLFLFVFLYVYIIFIMNTNRNNEMRYFNNAEEHLFQQQPVKPKWPITTNTK
jgi:hypothetical protein